MGGEKKRIAAALKRRSTTTTLDKFSFAHRCTCDTQIICSSQVYIAENNSICGAGWQLICPSGNRNNMLCLSGNLWSVKMLSVINIDSIPMGNHSIVLASWEVMYAQTCWIRLGPSHTYTHTCTQNTHTVRWIATPPRINTYQLQWAGALCSFLLILSMVIYCSVLVNSHIVSWKCGQLREMVEFKSKAQQPPNPPHPAICSLFMCILVHAGGEYMGWLNNNNIFVQRGMAL